MTEEEISQLKAVGYEEYCFPGEYRLLYNSSTLHAIRIYDNGQVWEKTTGEYIKIKNGNH